MEKGILVVILAILFIIIAAMFIIGYFVLNKKNNDYVEQNNDLAIENDEEDNSEENFIQEVNVNHEENAIQEESTLINDMAESNIIEDNVNENNDVEINVNDNYIEPEIKEEIEEVDDVAFIAPVINTMRDVVNVMINNKNYVFLANNNVVNVNDHIKLSLNGKEYHGVITKGIYQKDINDFKIAPQDLIIIEKE